MIIDMMIEIKAIVLESISNCNSSNKLGINKVAKNDEIFVKRIVIGKKERRFLDCTGNLN